MYKILTSLLMISLVTGLVTSCYYDKEEELYADYLAQCDTSAVTFSGNVLPVLNASCVTCHSESSAPALGNGYVLESWETVREFETKFPGTLVGSLQHAAGYAPMPKNGRKLTSCTIKKLEVWIKAGMPEN